MVQGTAWDIEDVCEHVLNKWTSSKIPVSRGKGYGRVEICQSGSNSLGSGFIVFVVFSFISPKLYS